MREKYNINRLKNITYFVFILIYGIIAFFAAYVSINTKPTESKWSTEEWSYNRKKPVTLTKEERKFLGHQNLNILPDDIQYKTQEPVRKILKEQNIFYRPHEIFMKPNKLHKTSLVTSTQCKSNFVKLLILVASKGTNYERRLAIRYTWGDKTTLKKFSSELYFLVSKPILHGEENYIAKEQEIFGDLITGSDYDDYDNVVQKTIFGLEWVSKYCNFKYLLKTDDDVFVYTKTIFKLIENLDKQNIEYLYTGNLVQNAYVLREGKYKITEEEYSLKYYPPYASGGGYILNNATVHALMSKINTYSTFKMEDVYIGILAHHLHIKATNQSHFEMQSDDCLFKAVNVVQHEIPTTDCMYQLFIKCVKEEACHI